MKSVYLLSLFPVTAELEYLNTYEKKAHRFEQSECSIRESKVERCLHRLKFLAHDRQKKLIHKEKIKCIKKFTNCDSNDSDESSFNDSLDFVNDLLNPVSACKNNEENN